MKNNTLEKPKTTLPLFQQVEDLDPKYVFRVGSQILLSYFAEIENELMKGNKEIIERYSNKSDEERVEMLITSIKRRAHIALGEFKILKEQTKQLKHYS